MTRAKWTGGMAQVAEHLFFKCEALSSNPIIMPKRRKKKFLSSDGPIHEQMYTLIL
jgi:hypothetical protein